MQQLQNNWAPKPCGQGADDDVIGEVESTDGNAFILHVRSNYGIKDPVTRLELRILSPVSVCT